MMINSETQPHKHDCPPYTPVERSQFFPELDWQFLGQYISPQDQPQAVKAFLRDLRANN